MKNWTNKSTNQHKTQQKQQKQQQPIHSPESTLLKGTGTTHPSSTGESKRGASCFFLSFFSSSAKSSASPTSPSSATGLIVRIFFLIWAFDSSSLPTDSSSASLLRFRLRDESPGLTKSSVQFMLPMLLLLAPLLAPLLALLALSLIGGVASVIGRWLLADSGNSDVGAEYLNSTF